MGDNKITLTNLNIRQSIAILLAKLVLGDMLFAVLIISFYFLLVQGEKLNQVASTNTVLFLIVFAIIGIFKILLSIYIVLKWLNEYYEITQDSVIHKSGIIFRKTERYSIENLREIDIQDGFIGQLFNFASISLYDKFLNNYLNMYFIHNPQRYAKVLKELGNNIEIKKDHVRLPFTKEEKILQE